MFDQQAVRPPTCPDAGVLRQAFQEELDPDEATEITRVREVAKVEEAMGKSLLVAPHGTEWTVVIAVRNLLQEPEEDDALEEIAEARPPRRVIGGVSVRF